MTLDICRLRVAPPAGGVKNPGSSEQLCYLSFPLVHGHHLRPFQQAEMLPVASTVSLCYLSRPRPWQCFAFTRHSILVVDFTDEELLHIYWHGFKSSASHRRVAIGICKYMLSVCFWGKGLSPFRYLMCGGTSTGISSGL